MSPSLFAAHVPGPDERETAEIFKSRAAALARISTDPNKTPTQRADAATEASQLRERLAHPSAHSRRHRDDLERLRNHADA